MSFPVHRPRRLRKTELLRGLVRETRLTVANLIYPMFVCPGTKVRQEVSSMPGVFQQSADKIVEDCREVESLGIPGVILFGLPETKDPRGISSLQKAGVVQRAIEAIQKAAHTGKIGDGKIFVTPVEQALRIRTGETGSNAL